MVRLCSIPSCDKIHFGRGYCNTHYSRWRRNGSATTLKGSGTHRMTKTREHETWSSMKDRCLNPNHPSYPTYGGRGIKICNKWVNDFISFYNDMGVRPTNKHSLDRIDVNGDYSPDNCRWATREQQQNNRRNNRYLTHKGKTLSVSQWSREIPIGLRVLMSRLRAGWTTEKALDTPVREKTRKNIYAKN